MSRNNSFGGKRGARASAIAGGLLAKVSPSRAAQVNRIKQARSAGMIDSSGRMRMPAGSIGGSVQNNLSSNDDCCPSGAGGLPNLPFRAVEYDLCGGKMSSNTSDDLTSTVISYNRSPLIPRNYTVANNVANLLAPPVGTPVLGPDIWDGVIFWMPGIANVQLAGFVTVTVAGITYDQGSNVVANDYTQTINLVTGNNNGPAIFGFIFRDANNQQVRLRSQTAGTVATAVGPLAVTIPAQDVSITFSAGWPAAAAPILVWPFNSNQIWIKQYTDYFAQNLG